MATTEVIEYTADDTLPKLTRTYDGAETGGDPDITAWTIKLRIRRPSQPILEKTATITDGPNGAFEFEFTTGDLVEGDGQEAEIEFEPDTGGNFTRGDLLFNVRGQLG
jgi:hypothetical protein